MTKDELFKKIYSCRDCDYKYGKNPFFFPMKEQKVMLITACPSIQAMFRPLTSIRFFRTICVALFGDANISPEYIKTLHDEIYWTHLHKCYNEEALRSGDFTRIPNKCMDVYIDQEAELLKPEITIAFGKEVAKRLFQLDLKEDIAIIEGQPKWSSKVFLADFPKTGAEKNLDKIRDSLSQMRGFEFMKRHENGNWTTSPDKQRQDVSKGLSVNLNFERETIEQLKLIPHDQSNDISWLENVVLPNIKNSETLARLHFFIEDQVKTMLNEVFSDPNKWRILKYLKQKEFASGRTLDQKTVYAYLKKNWKDAFRDYFSFLTRKGFKLPGDNNLDINKITDKLSELCTFRNCIVHNGGYAPPIFNGKRTQFEGIRWYVNLIYVSNEGIKSVSQFTREIISILSAHDQMRFRS